MTSLGSRMTVWYALFITGTVGAVLLTGRILLQIELIRGIDLLNAAEAQEIKDRVTTPGGLLIQEQLLQTISAHSKIDAPLYFFQVRNTRGELLFRSDNMASTVFPQNPENQSNWTTTADKLGGVRLSTFDIGSYRLQIATSVRVIDRLFNDYFQVSMVLLVAVAILSFWVGHRMSRVALDPLRQIQAAASRIGAQNLKERIPVGRSQDELASLAKLLNEMFDRLEVAFSRLSRFAGEASHELKTPLSIIRLQSEKLLLHGSLTPPQQEAVQQQLESISGLYLVIEKLLFIARSEAGGIALNTKHLSTRSFVEAFTEDALVLCEDHRIAFEISSNDDLRMDFDPALIRQVLLNLLSNALKVSPARAKITLASSCVAEKWKVTLDDEGPGLSSGFQGEEIFKPFVRLSPDLDWSLAGGTGLGLAICRSIIQLHKGTIRAESRKPEKGLRVVFELPLTDIPANASRAAVPLLS
jgi:signal transduction histidine kinase